MLERLFRSKKEQELRNEKEILEIEVERLKRDLMKKEAFIKCKNSLISEKENKVKEQNQWEEMERELKRYYKENNELKKTLEEREKVLELSHVKVFYLVPLEIYLSEVRYRSPLELLKKSGKNYVQDLNEKIIENLNIDEKVKELLKSKYEKFQKMEINWNVKTYLIKGEKLSKIYCKYRKFLNIISSETKEFMCDLEGYNFHESLKNYYSHNEIEELFDIYQEYMLRNRIEQ